MNHESYDEAYVHVGDLDQVKMATKMLIMTQSEIRRLSRIAGGATKQMAIPAKLSQYADEILGTESTTTVSILNFSKQGRLYNTI